MPAVLHASRLTGTGGQLEERAVFGGSPRRRAVDDAQEVGVGDQHHIAALARW